ncbi:calcium-binding protein [Stagnihabitans tardus]|uniref:Calcium-binding protein n=1 Tax=Stagnihabitans tardus TaxID=2699202 RepID=A0AAE5BTA3_9RHOB|nr:calcium-binding protein [Stagnihabitans tardus]NBZ86451.1 hypothetical protein [Stagnihabitans tardus]
MGDLTMGTINGSAGVDDNISSGGMQSWDTLFSSTFSGDDYVSIFSPHYDIHLGEGNDSVSGGIGGVAFGEAGNDRMDVSFWQGDHAHYGGTGDDRLSVFFGGTGATYFGSGGAGRDQFRDGSTASEATSMTFDGGSDFDVVTHTGTTAISLTLGGSGQQGAALKTYRAIEGVIGGQGADTMTGSGANNLMVGGQGADRISGLGGDDFLIGEGRGDSFVSAWLGLNVNFSPADAFNALNAAFGGAYAEDGGALNDTLYGGNGNDVLAGGDGADLLNGGAGTDWVTYLSSPEWATVAMSLATGGTVGHASGDVYVGVENVQGSKSNDTLGGNNGANEIRGMNGQDSLSGLLGDDTLIGAEGRDTLDGGGGADVLTGGDTEDAFVFGAGGIFLSIDTITDFQVGFDEIWLSAATFRRLAPAGGPLAAANFVLGSTALDRDDFILYDSATGALSYDANGRSAGGIVQFAQLATGLALTSDDFVIIA